MAIDFDVLTDELIRVARVEVGNRLATIEIETGLTPAVILSRDTGAKPNSPYIVVDTIVVDDSGSWLIASGINEDDNPCFSSYYRILFQYTVYGDNAMSIAQELKGKFRIGRILDEVKTNTTGEIEDVFAVNSLPEKLSTRYVEAAAFNLNFSITDTVVDVQTGYIDTIITTGEVLRDEDDVFDNPLDLDITVTSLLP
jgi:hypothetical protein